MAEDRTASTTTTGAQDARPDDHPDAPGVIARPAAGTTTRPLSGAEAPEGETPASFAAVRAVVRPDGVGEVTVGADVHPVVGAGPVEARAAVIAFLTSLARDRGVAVPVQIAEKDGAWTILVHPDGRLEESADADAGADSESGSDAGAGTDSASADDAAEPGEADEASEPDEPSGANDAPAPLASPPPPREPARRARRETAGPAPDLPTLDDLLATRPRPPQGPAELGWQSTVRRLTGGVVSPAPGRVEVRRRQAVATVQRSLDGPRTVVVLNPKGGAHKTTATLLIAATFGIHRGGYTLAWDNNETRGTLGWRSQHARHANTAVNLLQDLERFDDLRSGRVGDLDNYVRSQGSAQFDVLASDEDAASAASIDSAAFTALHGTLSRFYRVMVVDTGNNMRASNWQAAVEAADQLVIVSTVREDTAQSAAWAIDALRATGHDDAVRRAVTVLSAPEPRVDAALAARLHAHFGRLTRAVLDVPHDPALVAGGPLDVSALAPATREAWLHVTAAVADGL